MKILFIVTGIGLGDATREHAIIETILKKYKGAEILIAGYDNSYKYFSGKYPTIKIRGYQMVGRRMKFSPWSFVARNFLLPFYWLYSAAKLKKTVKEFNPDLIVSDFEPSGIAIAKTINKKCVAIFGFDPFLYDEYSKKHKVARLMALQAKYLKTLYTRSNFVVIPSLIKRRRTLVYNYVNPIVRKSFLKLPTKAKLMKELNLKKEPIVVMLGGSKFGMKLAKTLASISKEFKSEQFIIFGGEKVQNKSKNLTSIPFSKDFHKFLKVSKAAITLGGQTTLSECLSMEKPMLIYPIEDHIEQLLNAYALREYAVTKRFSEGTLKEDINELLNILPDLQKKIKKLKIKTDGAEQVAGLIKMLVLGK